MTRINKLENLFLIRNAESTGDENTPSKDVGLTKTGDKQAKILGQKIGNICESMNLTDDSVHVYMGNYLKVTATKNLMIGGFMNYINGYTTNLLLNGRSYGDFDGLNRDAREKKFPVAAQKYQNGLLSIGKFDLRAPGGENIPDVCERLVQFTNQVIYDIKNSAQNMIILSSGTPLSAIVKCIMGYDMDWMRKERIPNAAIHHLHCDENGKWADKGLIFAGFEQKTK